MIDSNSIIVSGTRSHLSPAHNRLIVVVKEKTITNEIPPSTLQKIISPLYKPSSLKTTSYPAIEKDNHIFSPSCKPLTARIKIASVDGMNIFLIITPKGTFTDNSIDNDANRKDTGITMFLAIKFIVSNETM